MARKMIRNRRSNTNPPGPSEVETASWLAVFFVTIGWSFTGPSDLFTWSMEVAPAVAYVATLAILRNRFRFTRIAVWLILVHCMVLMIGGRYTYAEVPLFNWLSDEFGLERNYYDRVGHFAQGFIPALLAREVVIRVGRIRSGPLAGFLAICVALAVSAVYEIIEMAAAVLTGEAAEAFLGTQGDVWDTQWDMTWAMIGAVAALFLLRSIHDRQIRRRK